MKAVKGLIGDAMPCHVLRVGIADALWGEDHAFDVRFEQS